MGIGQTNAGFDARKAKDLLAICNSYTFLRLYESDDDIVPAYYRKIYTSQVTGLDNVFQVYEGNGIGVINFRGSTERFSSKLANAYSAMIKAQGVIKVDGLSYPYAFATDTAAAVHAGYALAIVLMSSNLIEQINRLNIKEIYEITFTGHSQGGALAQLSRAFVENVPPGLISGQNKFTTYTFANPMCGNLAFAREYNNRFAHPKTSYTVVNPADAVPRMPLHLPKKKKGGGSFFQNIASGFVQGEMPKMNDLLAHVFEPALSKQVSSGNNVIEKLVSKTYVSIDMPDYLRSVDYSPCGAICEIAPFPRPAIPIDTTGMAIEEKALLIQDEKGRFYNPNAGFSQHHPYHYYVGFLKQFFPEDYRKLDRLYLPEDVE
jgi:hypothetical protein